MLDVIQVTDFTEAVSRPMRLISLPFLLTTTSPLMMMNKLLPIFLLYDGFSCAHRKCSADIQRFPNLCIAEIGKNLNLRIKLKRYCRNASLPGLQSAAAPLPDHQKSPPRVIA